MLLLLFLGGGDQQHGLVERSTPSVYDVILVLAVPTSPCCRMRDGRVSPGQFIAAKPTTWAPFSESIPAGSACSAHITHRAVEGLGLLYAPLFRDGTCC